MVSQSPVDNDPQRQLRLACEELSRRLRAGEDCHAEGFLDAYPDLASHPELALELICTEFLVRWELGERPDPAQWLDRFPQWRDQLQSRLQTPKVRDGGDTPNPSTVPHSPVSTRPSPPEADHRARTFGRYELLEEVGCGGMGIVYKARDTVLNRLVALKMIRTGVLARPEEVQRFYREARAVAQLTHAHIVPLYEIGQHEDRLYFTMAFAPGGSLAPHRQRFAGDVRGAAALVEKIARAVHHAHIKGILHRDLKPGNILLDEQGEPLVSDFGLAKILDADAELTQTGVVVGTPAYLAPELLSDHPGPATPHSDIWSLGVLLYELLTGKRPFTGKGAREATRLIATAEPPRPRDLNRAVDRQLEAVVLKCLDKDPARRYATAEALADDLGRWLRGEPVSVRPQRWPARLWRAVRRHPLVLTTALLLPVAGVAALLAVTLRGAGEPPEPEDPDRFVAVARGELLAGRAVRLINETGRPQWSRWSLGRGAVTDCPMGDGTFYVHSFDPCLLELLRPPLPPRYLLTAQVRHIVSERGEVGIYFAHSRRTTAQGVEHCYCQLIFNDQKAAPPKWAKLQLHRYRERGPLPVFDYPGTTGISWKIPARRPADPLPWRTLEVKVTPEKIQARWENEPFKEIARPFIVKRATVVLKEDPDLDPRREFLPQGGLGLYVDRGGASYRRVVIQPIK
jgi:serine/threonine-protein kinase